MVSGGVCKNTNTAVSVMTRINYGMFLCSRILCRTLFKQHQRFVRKPSKFDLGSPVKPVFSLYLDTRSRFSSFFYKVRLRHQFHLSSVGGALSGSVHMPTRHGMSAMLKRAPFTKFLYYSLPYILPLYSTEVF